MVIFRLKIKSRHYTITPLWIKINLIKIYVLKYEGAINYEILSATGWPRKHLSFQIV